MSDEQYGALDLIEQARKVRRVGAHPAERIGWSDDRHALLLQTLNNAGATAPKERMAAWAYPTGRVGEGAVYDDNGQGASSVGRCLRHVTFLSGCVRRPWGRPHHANDCVDVNSMSGGYFGRAQRVT